MEALKRQGDLIAAPITALGGAVASVRASGPGAWRAAAACLSSWPDPPEPWRARFCRTAWGEEAVAIPFPSGASYTGEESCEISVHGSRASVSRLLDALAAEGARLAEPGEFTLRAFLNGRVDLPSAEAVAIWASARSSGQLAQAASLASGALSSRVHEAREELASALAMIEASVDFEEEVGPLDRGAFRLRLEAADQMLSRVPVAGSRLLRVGARIAISGPPNAGKSSLLNAVLRQDRAIVAALPGTTRDTIEEEVEIGGLPCVLIDTAGDRETDDEAEALGIERSARAREEADLIWQVYDAAQGEAPVTDGKAILIAAKADLRRGKAGIPVSARTGEGLDELLRATAERLAPAGATPPVLDRHASLLSEARSSIAAALADSRRDVPDDLLAVELGSAIRRLGEITGEEAGPDILERIFRDFCIGK